MNKLKPLNLLFILLMVGLIAGAILLISDHHLLRSSLVRTIELGSPHSLYSDEACDLFIYEDARRVVSIAQVIPDSCKKQDEFDTALSILSWLNRTYHSSVIASASLIPENPELILKGVLTKGVRGSCYNDAIIYSTLVQAAGLTAC